MTSIVGTKTRTGVQNMGDSRGFCQEVGSMARMPVGVPALNHWISIHFNGEIYRRISEVLPALLAHIPHPVDRAPSSIFRRAGILRNESIRLRERYGSERDYIK